MLWPFGTRSIPNITAEPQCCTCGRTRQAQMVASSTMQHHDQRTWTTSTAPNPSTIIWENLG